MSYSVPQKTIDIVKKWEGFRSEAYQCSAGIWTVGYGTTRINNKPVKSRDTVTEPEAERLLIQYLKRLQTQILALVI